MALQIRSGKEQRIGGGTGKESAALIIAHAAPRRKPANASWKPLLQRRNSPCSFWRSAIATEAGVKGLRRHVVPLQQSVSSAQRPAAGPELIEYLQAKAGFLGSMGMSPVRGRTRAGGGLGPGGIRTAAANAVMKPAADQRSNLIDQRISPFLREAHNALLDAARLRSATRTLVLECRDGWAAEEAWRRVVRGYVCGVDGSHTMITLASQYRSVQDRLEFMTWDRKSLPFRDCSFDVVISSYSLDRFPQPVELLREARRVLVPGGKLLLLEPSKYGFWGTYLLVDWFFRWSDPRHIRHYSVRQLLGLLRSAGFEYVRLIRRFQSLRAGGKVFANGILIEGVRARP